MLVNEIFYSIQGESTAAGRPCVFIRLSGCNLSCRYCDTGYALTGGEEMAISEILTAIARFKCSLVEVTGGEPLLQSSTSELLKRLVAADYEVLLETNGSLLLPENRGWRVVLDVKGPGSGMEDFFRLENIKRLAPGDEVKFVISDRFDFDWACRCIADWSLSDGGREILMSPVSGMCEPAELAEWILKEHLPVRLQLQLHNLLWPEGEPKTSE